MIPVENFQQHFGDSFRRYCVLPKITPALAEVELQEVFGINTDLNKACS
ncbi:MAG: hypothetical protein JWM78_3313 [Verrucomicrobiaceae bacterium]|nr:hypothetical protein [Verrucomicrobiaceae bacterium]